MRLSGKHTGLGWARPCTGTGSKRENSPAQAGEGGRGTISSFLSFTLRFGRVPNIESTSGIYNDGREKQTEIFLNPLRGPLCVPSSLERKAERRVYRLAQTGRLV